MYFPRKLTRFLCESAFSGSSAANIAEDTKMHTSTLFVKYEWLTTLLQKTLKISIFFYKINNKRMPKLDQEIHDFVVKKP